MSKPFSPMMHHLIEDCIIKHNHMKAISLWKIQSFKSLFLQFYLLLTLVWYMTYRFTFLCGLQYSWTNTNPCICQRLTDFAGVHSCTTFTILPENCCYSKSSLESKALSWLYYQFWITVFESKARKISLIIIYKYEIPFLALKNKVV